MKGYLVWGEFHWVCDHCGEYADAYDSAYAAEADVVQHLREDHPEVKS